MLPTYRVNPTVPRGYELAGLRFGIVVPVATTNLLPNPSVETGLTDWTNYNTATLVRSTAYSWAGIYSVYASSLGVNGGPAYFLDSVANVVEGTTYTASAWFLGEPGKTYQLRCATVSESRSAPVVATGGWQRLSVTHVADGNQFLGIAVFQNQVGGQNAFYTDAWQLEALDYPTTYCDGDRRGFVSSRSDYAWLGTPHASTSTRSGQTRAGGRVLMLSDLGFRLLSMIGLSMAPLNVIALPLANGGSFYQDTRPAASRDFTLVGDFYAPNLQQLQAQKAEFLEALNPYLTAVRQPLVLTYQAVDDRNRPVSEPCEIVAHYTDGMAGVTDGYHQERLSCAFRMFLPAILAAPETGAILNPTQTVFGVNYIAQRSPAGNWDDLGGGVTGGAGSGGGLGVEALAYGPSGALYAGGNFINAGGVAAADYVARWDGVNVGWNALATGANDTVKALAIGPDGALYAGGYFTSASGVANTSRIAKWNGSTWAALTTGVNGAVWALAFGPDGALYVGGDFTLAGGVANTVRIAKWDGSAWTPLSTGANGLVRALRFGLDGALYAAGDFTTMGGSAIPYLAAWDGSSWAAVGAAPNNALRALAVGADGTLYAGGVFTTIGGVAAPYLAAWNGTAWRALGAGVDNSVAVLEVAPDGTLYVGGAFTTAGALDTPDGFARWLGMSWLLPDIDPPNTTTIQAMVAAGDGTLTIGYSTDGSAEAAAVNTMTNDGTAPAYPTFVFTGAPNTAAPIYQIVNTTTGAGIYFDGLQISPGETITITLDPQNIRMVSSFQGNIIRYVIPGSNVAGWFLQPGENTVSIWAPNPLITLAATWREGYIAIEHATRR